jgi:hypothetical protein
LLSCLILQLSFLLILKTDSIVFNLKSGNKTDALSLISRVYESDAETIYSSLEKTTSSEDSSVSLRAALFDKEHRRGTHIVFILMCLMMATGIDGLNMFSNRIMTDMNRDKEVTVSANTATVIFGWINFISPFFCFMGLTKYFGRVQILFWAHIFMGTV